MEVPNLLIEITTMGDNKQNYKIAHVINTFHDSLKVVSATFLLVCLFLGLNGSTCQARKNVFYFT